MADFLIECKYTSPGINWVFTPIPEISMSWTDFFSIIDHLSLKKMSKHFGSDISLEYQYCLKGIELQEKSSNPQSIRHGVEQLRYAIPSYQLDIYRTQMIPEISDIHYIIPILVTTAPLYVLNSNLALSTISNSEKLEDIAEKKDAIILYKEFGIQLDLYIKELFNKFKFESKVQQVFDEHKKALEKMKFKFIPEFEDLVRSINYRACTILVVNAEYLDKLIKRILDDLEKNRKYIKRIPAKILKDLKLFQYKSK